MTTPEEAGRMIERALIGTVYDSSRDTPERMIAQLRRSFPTSRGGASAAARALDVNPRTMRRWFREGLPRTARSREQAREQISHYYAGRRVDTSRAALRGARGFTLELKQNPDGDVDNNPRNRTVGSGGTFGARGVDPDVVNKLLGAYRSGQPREQLADILVNSVQDSFYRRAIAPVAAGAEPEADEYATAGWRWDGLSIV